MRGISEEAARHLRPRVIILYTHVQSTLRSSYSRWHFACHSFPFESITVCIRTAGLSMGFAAGCVLNMAGKIRYSPFNLHIQILLRSTPRRCGSTKLHLMSEAHAL